MTDQDDIIEQERRGRPGTVTYTELIRENWKLFLVFTVASFIMAATYVFLLA